MNIAGPDLPTKLASHSMVPLGFGQAILGGFEDPSHFKFRYKREIYYLSCSQHICKMSSLNQELSVSRGYFVAIPIPDRISGCILKSKFHILM